MPYSVLEAQPISKLCTVVDCEHKTAPYVDESEYFVVRTSNVRDGQLVMEDMKYTTNEGYKEWTQRAVPEFGDVLFTREAPAGESCLVPRDKKVCMGQRMVMLRPKKKITDPIFLSLILNTERIKADISRLSIGSTVSRINIADIKKLRVACPPLPEQQKIAKTLSTWDKAIAITERLIAASQQQKKSLMQQLLTGKKRLINPDTGMVFKGDWEEVTVDETCIVGRGRVISKIEISDNQGIYPVYSSQTLNNGVMGCIGTYDFEGEYVTWTTDGVNAGTVFFRSGRFNCTNVCGTLKPKDIKSLDTKYLALALSLETFKYVSHTLANPKLMNGVMKTVLFRMPLLSEQQKIASVLTAADKEIELLEIKFAHLKDEKKALMQQLLTGKRRVKVEEVEVG